LEINCFLIMSLHETVSNKERPCYKCIESINTMVDYYGMQQLRDKFNIGWEYSISYVESRIRNPIEIKKHFIILE
jgi:hypothetical protein